MLQIKLRTNYVSVKLVTSMIKIDIEIEILYENLQFRSEFKFRFSRSEVEISLYIWHVATCMYYETALY